VGELRNNRWNCLWDLAVETAKIGYLRREPGFERYVANPGLRSMGAGDDVEPDVLVQPASREPLLTGLLRGGPSS